MKYTTQPGKRWVLEDAIAGSGSSGDRQGEYFGWLTPSAGVGVVSPQGVWFEGSWTRFYGLKVNGWETWLAGYVFDRLPRPSRWDFSVPVYAGYRFTRLPGLVYDPEGTEDLHMVLAGVRVVGTRYWGGADGGGMWGLELSASLSAASTVARSVNAWDPEPDANTTTAMFDALFLIGLTYDWQL